METKASRRHSEGDMKLIRTARKNLMDTLNVLVELGDDGAEDVLEAAQEQAPVKRHAIKDVATSAVLTQLLAQTVSMWYAASAAHWNVTSLDFPQYHAFFGMVYEEMEAHIDPTAEFIRAQGAKTPTSLGQLAAMCADYGVTPDSSVTDLLECLANCNADMLATIAQGIAIAGTVGEYGVQNYLQDRMTLSQKLAWMMNASLSGDAEMPSAEMSDEFMTKMVKSSAMSREKAQATVMEIAKQFPNEASIVYENMETLLMNGKRTADELLQAMQKKYSEKTLTDRNTTPETVENAPAEVTQDESKSVALDSTPTMITEAMSEAARRLLGV